MERCWIHPARYQNTSRGSNLAFNNYQIPLFRLCHCAKTTRRKLTRSSRYDSINRSAANRRHGRGQFYSIYVANFPGNSSDYTLYQLFNPFGAIASAKAIMDLSMNKCKGYGFVSYEDPHRFIKELDGISYKGQRLQVNFKN